MAVEFHDFSIEVKEVMDSRIHAVLEECSGELESQAKRNSRVASGQTKNSFSHKVVKKESSKEFEYEFIGWDKETKAFFENTEIRPMFKAKPIKYNYKFVKR